MSFDIDVTLTRGSARISARFVVEGGLTALFGASGAGKTSVLNAVAGLIQPDTGRIVVGDHTLFDKDRKISLPAQARACGYVFQDSRLFPHMNVRRNLLYGWKLAPVQRRWMALEEAAAFLGIEHLLDRMPRTLSGGEMQRVAIGRALLCAPRFLLMDEPLSSLDEDRRGGVMDVIERIRDELHLPILYVSHDKREVDRLADHVVELSAGASRVREGIRLSGAASARPEAPLRVPPRQTSR